MSPTAGSDAPIVVVGAGGMAREAAVWARAAGRNVLGLLDEDDGSHGTTVGDLTVLGDLGWLDGDGAGQGGDAPQPEACVAVGSPRARRALLARIVAAGHAVATIVAPDAVVGERVRVGAGSLVCPQSVLTCDVLVGRGVIVSVGALLHHDDVVGDHAFIGPGAMLSGNVTVGDGAWIGVGATVKQGITIGQGAVVGAGAVVVTDVPADVVVAGVPAVVLRPTDDPW